MKSEAIKKKFLVNFFSRDELSVFSSFFHGSSSPRSFFFMLQIRNFTAATSELEQRRMIEDFSRDGKMNRSASFAVTAN